MTSLPVHWVPIALFLRICLCRSLLVLFFSFFFFFYLLVLAALVLVAARGLSLAVVSRGWSLAVACGPLTVVASPAQHGLWGLRAQ